MMLLPIGDVLISDGTTNVARYSPNPADGSARATWRPAVEHAPAVLRPGSSHAIIGLQLNGLSQAVAYGDDAAMATNYPLLQLRYANGSAVVYCKTWGHTLGVATGTNRITTMFDVPMIPEGVVELRVITNGIASEPPLTARVSLTV